VKRLGTAIVLAGLLSLLTAGCSASDNSARRSSTVASRSASPSGASSGAIPASALTGRILFARAGGEFGDETVFTARADGTEVRRVTPLGRGQGPRWSPDGNHIFIAAQEPNGAGSTGIIEADGGGEQVLPLAMTGINLICSQGGQSLVTHRFACEGWSDSDPHLQGIYTVGPGGRHPVRLTPCCSPQGERPIGFSPDGTEVYFFRTIAGFPYYGQDLEGSIFVINANRTGVRRITASNRPVEVVGNPGGRLSPDGKWLVFTSSGQIWTVRTDGKHLTKIFSDPHGRLAITPTWSPNGQFILFALDPPGQLGLVSNPPQNQLCVVRRNGTGLTTIVGTADFKREPDWTAE
jgi:Tol biopolymer transport system component